MSKISLGDQELERMIHEISTMGQDLGKAEADYERLVSEMKYERDLAFIELKDTKMTLKERESLANTQPQVISYIDKIAEAKKEYLALRHRIKAREIWCDMFRSINSKNKREMKFYQQLS